MTAEAGALLIERGLVFNPIAEAARVRDGLTSAVERIQVFGRITRQGEKDLGTALRGLVELGRRDKDKAVEVITDVVSQQTGATPETAGIFAEEITSQLETHLDQVSPPALVAAAMVLEEAEANAASLEPVEFRAPGVLRRIGRGAAGLGRRAGGAARRVGRGAAGLGRQVGGAAGQEARRLIDRLLGRKRPPAVRRVARRGRVNVEGDWEDLSIGPSISPQTETAKYLAVRGGLVLLAVLALWKGPEYVPFIPTVGKIGETGAERIRASGRAAKWLGERAGGELVPGQREIIGARDESKELGIDEDIYYNHKFTIEERLLAASPQTEQIEPYRIIGWFVDTRSDREAIDNPSKWSNEVRGDMKIILKVMGEKKINSGHLAEQLKAYGHKDLVGSKLLEILVRMYEENRPMTDYDTEIQAIQAKEKTFDNYWKDRNGDNRVGVWDVLVNYWETKFGIKWSYQKGEKFGIDQFFVAGIVDSFPDDVLPQMTVARGTQLASHILTPQEIARGGYRGARGFGERISRESNSRLALMRRRLPGRV